MPRAFDVAETLADAFVSAMVELMLGRVDLMRGDLPKAIGKFEESLRVSANSAARGANAADEGTTRVRE